MRFEKDLNNASERARKVKLFAHDVHGVLTQNVIYCDSEGNRRYAFWHMDGFGDLSLMANGIKTVFLDSTSIDEEGFYRAKELKLDKMYFKVTDKLVKLDELMKTFDVSYEGVGYLGCEITDLEIMEKVGFSVATADAIDDAKEIAHYILQSLGGRGAVREVSEFILRAMGKWDEWANKVTKRGYK